MVFESAHFCEELIGQNGASGMSDIEGKAAREAVSECGQRANFNADVGLLQSGGLEDVDDFAVRCDCFRHQLPDRVPLRQLVGFVISSSLHQRAATSTPCQQCLEQSEFNGLAGIGKHIKLRLCCASDSDRSFLRVRRQKPQSEDLFFELARALA